MTIYKGKIKGDLTLLKGDDAAAVTSIGGSLDVSEGATCDLPAVTSIGGSLDVSEGATCDLPAVTSIGGYLYVSEGATCDLPAVTSIGGYPVPEPAIAQARLRAIADRVVNDPAALDMGEWHCGTQHCIAGWAVHLEPGGYDLEKKVGSTLQAGNILLGPDASKFFFAEKSKALAMLADAQAAK